jgi:hypothetical protein
MDNPLRKAPPALVTLGGLWMVAAGWVGIGLVVALVGGTWLVND